MKKRFILVYFIFFVCSLYALDFKTYRDENALTRKNERSILLKKNSIVNVEDFFIYEKETSIAKKLKCDNAIMVIYNGERTAINIDSIIPAETKKLFDDSLISYKQKEKGKFLSSLTELEILKSNTRDSYYNIHKERIDAYEKERGIYDLMEWYEDVSFNEYYLNNLFIIVGDSKKYNFYYLIKKIEKIKDGYIVLCELNNVKTQQNSYRNETLEELKNHKDIKYKLIIDGDYINFFSENENLLFTLVYIDKSIAEQYELLFKEGKADLSKVTWPRHADGSCDYDGSKK